MYSRRRRRTSPTRSSRTSRARRRSRSRPTAGCSSRRSSASCASSTNGMLVAQPALDLGGVLCTARDGASRRRGRPGLRVNGFVYLYYTRSKAGSCVNRVSRFTMIGRRRSALRASSCSSTRFLADRQPQRRRPAASATTATSTSASATAGCDYAGDSGCAGQNDASRDQHVLVGKILRITRTGGIPPSNPSRAPAPRAATSRAGRRPATGARRPSPGACGIRSGSRSTRTPPARASSSTTSVRGCGRRSTSGRRAPTTAGTSARGRARTARRRTAARRLPG